MGNLYSFNEREDESVVEYPIVKVTYDNVDYIAPVVSNETVDLTVVQGDTDKPS